VRISLLGLRTPMDHELGELMARRYGQVNVEIWNDPDFRALPPAAQHLYLLLWTSPHLTFCGLHEWRPGRLTKLSHGFTEDHTKAVSAALQARHFLVVDEDTEEVLIRSWARFDELLKQPRLAVSYAAAYAATYSPTLRQVLVHETEKMRKLWPDLACWKDSRVTSILDHPSVSAKDLPTPKDPFGDGFGDGFALGLPQTQGGVWPPVYPPPTPAPTPTPSKQSAGADKSTTTRATSIPKDWSPTDKHQELATELGLDIALEAAKFVDHFAATGKAYKDWDAAFRNWLRNSTTFGARVTRLPVQQDNGWDRPEMPAPPPEIADDPERYARWMAEQGQR
jgi:hypothetical protein